MFGRSSKSTRHVALTALALMLALALVGCAPNEPADTDAGQAPAAPVEVVLASTTSTQDSGLFDVLVPAFEADNPDYRIQVIAVGTGEALALGESKDADVLLVHAKASEEDFVANGFGYERTDVMYNDYVIVGPAADPAGVKGAADTTAAMKAIMDGGVFVSRGDDSGTHKKELSLWTAAGVQTPDAASMDWYESTGQGMGETLAVTTNKQAYTIADRATYLSMKDVLDLEIVYEGAAELLNQYGVIVVTDAKQKDGGQVFCDWITSPAGQAVIQTFGVDTYGQPLFFPNAQ